MALLWTLASWILLSLVARAVTAASRDRRDFCRRRVIAVPAFVERGPRRAAGGALGGLCPARRSASCPVYCVGAAWRVSASRARKAGRLICEVALIEADEYAHVRRHARRHAYRVQAALAREGEVVWSSRPTQAPRRRSTWPTAGARAPAHAPAPTLVGLCEHTLYLSSAAPDRSRPTARAATTSRPGSARSVALDSETCASTRVAGALLLRAEWHRLPGDLQGGSARRSPCSSAAAAVTVRTPRSLAFSTMVQAWHRRGVLAST